VEKTVERKWNHLIENTEVLTSLPLTLLKSLTGIDMTLEKA